MITRVPELCRKLKPVLGRKIDGLWAAYLAESDPAGRADIEQTLELLAAKHLGQNYEPDRAPFPPPARAFATSGDIPIGMVAYADRAPYSFALRSARLPEHVLIAGRSGSGKTNLTFVLLDRLIERGVKVLALDWKRGYRDLLGIHPDLRVHTIGREIAPFRFNPLIPPPGCEPHVWIKLITDAMARAYLGGEGVISLLVAGLDLLYTQHNVFSGRPTRWPTVRDLLEWLRATKLRGRAALWQASAERILLAMTYGEFGAVVDTHNNRHVQELLDQNVILEMDGLSSSSDRVLFSEALTLYLYRYRLSQGPRSHLTNIIVLEEAHNLLHARAADVRERMKGDYSDTAPYGPAFLSGTVVPPLPVADEEPLFNESTHPPSPEESLDLAVPSSDRDAEEPPPIESLGRETVRFLADVAARPLSPTVSRYQRLHFSRRRGNAIRQDLLAAGLIEAVAIATRSGQVVLYQLTDAGRSTCQRLGVDPGPLPRASLEHSYWADRLSEHFENQGYRVSREHAITGDGVVDLVAENDRERVAIKVETGKSDIAENIQKLAGAPFDRIVLVATSPAAVAACRQAMDAEATDNGHAVQLLTWLDL